MHFLFFRPIILLRISCSNISPRYLILFTFWQVQSVQLLPTCFVRTCVRQMVKDLLLESIVNHRLKWFTNRIFYFFVRPEPLFRQIYIICSQVEGLSILEFPIKGMSCCKSLFHDFILRLFVFQCVSLINKIINSYLQCLFQSILTTQCMGSMLGVCPKLSAVVVILMTMRRGSLFRFCFQTTVYKQTDIQFPWLWISKSFWNLLLSHSQWSCLKDIQHLRKLLSHHFVGCRSGSLEIFESKC